MDLKSTITQLIAILENDALKAILPLISTFFASAAANPTKLGILAAVSQLEVSALAAAPQLEAAVIQQISTTLQAKIQELIASTQTAAAPAKAA